MSTGSPWRAGGSARRGSRVRPWTVDDAEAALAVYGTEDVARWLSPAMDRVTDVDRMRSS